MLPPPRPEWVQLSEEKKRMLDKEEVAGIAEYECDRGNAEEATH